VSRNFVITAFAGMTEEKNIHPADEATITIYRGKIS
jgi:hypothetical protein